MKLFFRNVVTQIPNDNTAMITFPHKKCKRSLRPKKKEVLGGVKQRK
jgi:hypothetical protein